MKIFTKAATVVLFFTMPATAETCTYIGTFGSKKDNAKFYQTSSGAITFISDMDVNTDGAQKSYHTKDIGYYNSRNRINTRIGLNTICNGVRIMRPNGSKLYGLKDCKKLLREFERIRDFGWVKRGENFVNFFGIETIGSASLKPTINELRERKPCIIGDYFVSQIARQLPNAGRYGDCNPEKWLDAERIPAVVVPLNKKMRSLGVRVFDLAVIRMQNGNRIGAIVGDTNPNKVGEVTVKAAMQLTGKPSPKVYRDLYKLTIGKKVVEYIIFPNSASKIENLKNTDNAKIQQFSEELYVSANLDQNLPACE